MPASIKWRKGLKLGLCILWVAAIGLAGMGTSERGEAAALPPLGERLYCPTPEGRIIIVAVAQAKLAGHQRCFRDPSRGGNRILKREEAKPLPPRPVRRQRQKAATVARSSRSHIELAPLEINGKVREPRLPFALAPLPLPRADEPIAPQVQADLWELLPEP